MPELNAYVIAASALAGVLVWLLTLGIQIGRITERINSISSSVETLQLHGSTQVSALTDRVVSIASDVQSIKGHGSVQVGVLRAVVDGLETRIEAGEIDRAVVAQLLIGIVRDIASLSGRTTRP